MTYGQSVTDACIDWSATVQVLDRLREGVRARRSIVGPPKGGLNPRRRMGQESSQGETDFNDVEKLFPVV